jgi:hypothetical protein
MRLIHQYRLLSEILQQQDDDLAKMVSQISDVRLLAALRGELRLTIEEQKQLWSSPATRQRMLFLKQLEMATHLSGYPAIKPIVSKAAASINGEVQQVDIEQAEYQLSIIPHDAQGLLWEIVLVVSENWRKKYVNGLILVEQETGHIWLSGLFDENGELSQFWSFNESPVPRLKKYTLLLLPR